jgi:hypothetical protein
VLTKARDNLIAVKNLTKQGLTFKALAKTEEVAAVPAHELHISAEERKRALLFMEWHGRQCTPPTAQPS